MKYSFKENLGCFRSNFTYYIVKRVYYISNKVSRIIYTNFSVYSGAYFYVLNWFLHMFTPKHYVTHSIK